MQLFSIKDSKVTYVHIVLRQQKEKKMKKTETQKITLGALMIALGLIIPFFTSHMFGVPGTILLPMHYPVMLAGMLCGPLYGGLVGIIVPILSSLLTGMPPVFPMLPLMTFQLFFMGLVPGLVMKKWGKIIPAALASIVASWVAYAIALFVLKSLPVGAGLKMQVIPDFIAGLPGVIGQIILIPIITAFVNRYVTNRR